MAEPTSSTVENPIDLPTGEPIPTAPASSSAQDVDVPKPTESKKANSSSSSSSNVTTSPLKALLLSLPSNTDAFLAHVQRCLATPSGIDTLLLFICYTSRFSSAVLSSLSQSLLRRSARELVALAFTLPPKTAIIFAADGPNAAAATTKNTPIVNIIARLAAVLATRLKNLGSLASETRTIARLWALIGMYFWAKQLTLKLVSSLSNKNKSLAVEEEKEGSNNNTPPPRESKLVTLVDWTQLICCTAFQVLENGAYLSSRGILGWSPEKQGRAYVMGSRWLAAYTGLELGKLLAQLLAKRQGGVYGEEKTITEESDEEREKMAAVKRSMAINLAWAPLTLHWSTETGLLSDGLVGLGGCIPGVIQMRKLWRETAQ